MRQGNNCEDQINDKGNNIGKPATTGITATTGTTSLCAVVAECCLLLWNSPKTSQTAGPTNHTPYPAAAPCAGPTTPNAHSRGCI